MLSAPFDRVKAGALGTFPAVSDNRIADDAGFPPAIPVIA
jgi:hypothetical protein